MTEAKHTPGPWSPFDDPKSNYGLQVNADNVIKAKKVVCRVGGPDRVANARLIAAAPDMLEALRGLLPIAINDGPGGCDGKTPGCPQCDAIKIARAAIAKATGG